MENEKIVFVVTCPENGWDCVVGVYEAKDEDEVYNYLQEMYGKSREIIENEYVVHEERIIKL